jgi:hypothetical protein
MPGPLLPLLLTIGGAVWKGINDSNNQKKAEKYQRELDAKNDADQKRDQRAMRIANLLKIMGVQNAEAAPAGYQPTPAAPHMASSGLAQGLMSAGGALGDYYSQQQIATDKPLSKRKSMWSGQTGDDVDIEAMRQKGYI